MFQWKQSMIVLLFLFVKQEALKQSQILFIETFRECLSALFFQNKIIDFKIFQSVFCLSSKDWFWNLIRKFSNFPKKGIKIRK